MAIVPGSGTGVERARPPRGGLLKDRVGVRGPIGTLADAETGPRHFATYPLAAPLKISDDEVTGDEVTANGIAVSGLD